MTTSSRIRRAEHSLHHLHRQEEAQQSQVPVPEERQEQYFVSESIDNDETKKFTLIDDELCALFNPLNLKVVHHARKLFWNAKRDGEPVHRLLGRLENLAIACTFGPNNDDMLLNKMISLQEGHAFDRLCKEDENLTLPQALQIITIVEFQRNDKHQKANNKQSNSAKRHQTPAWHATAGEKTTIATEPAKTVHSLWRNQPRQDRMRIQIRDVPGLSTTRTYRTGMCTTADNTSQNKSAPPTTVETIETKPTKIGTP